MIKQRPRRELMYKEQLRTVVFVGVLHKEGGGQRGAAAGRLQIWLSSISGLSIRDSSYRQRLAKLLQQAQRHAVRPAEAVLRTASVKWDVYVCV